MPFDPYSVIPQPSLGVLYEPAARHEANLAGTTAVVIDAIRATTTVTLALAAGATEVRPFRTKDQVQAEKERRAAGTVVTAGERKGIRIEGLDLNNSPSAMTSDMVGGRALLLTTTNGTGAVHDAMRAAEVLVACFPNRAAVARACVARGRRVAFVLAGTVGTVSFEDALVSGAVIESIAETAGGEAFTLEDSARLALAAWRGVRDRLADHLARTWGGRFVVSLGFRDDLALCGRVDTTDVVPVVRGDPPVMTAGAEAP